MRSVLLVLLFAANALAQADLSTPKAAAQSLFNAINNSDAAAVRGALYAADEQQAEYATAMADLIIAGKKLGDAGRARFGAAGAAIGAGTLDPSDAARIDAATVELSGDVAKVIVPDQPRPMSFRRNRDGTWGLVITDASTATTQSIAKQSRLVRMLAEGMNKSAAEIQAGDYKTPEAATTAIQSRLHGVMLQFHRPSTTRATTGPATNATAEPLR